ncbi:MAG: hypothetical protein QXV32_02800 [Conexivisphaerales archaeon]
MIRLAFFGWGNSARAVARAVELAKKGEEVGIWHRRVGGYDASDVEVVCAFDIDSESLAKKNGIEVFPGISADDLPSHMTKERLKVADRSQVLDRLKQFKVDVAFNLISSGQEVSSKEYARLSAQHGAAFANGTAASVVNDDTIVKQFEKEKLPLAGDDLMSQVGGTVLHRGLVDFLESRGVKVSRSYQLDVGGSTDTLNTISEEVRAAKRRIKSQSIASEVEGSMETVAGTTDYVDFLGSRRTVYLWLECLAPMNEKYTIDVFYKSSDPANAVNVVLDVARALAAEKRKGNGGIAHTVSAYGFKNPPLTVKARDALSRFEAEYAR